VTPTAARLLHLQDLDSSIDALLYRQDHLPERVAVDDLSASLDAMRRKAGDHAGEVRKLEQRRSMVEAELAATDERRKLVSGRLYSAQTTSARDLAAMQAEMETLDAKVSGLEDEILGLLDSADVESGALGELEVLIEPAEASLSEAREALARAREAIDVELRALRDERETATSGLAEGLLRRYEALRARLGGVAVARVVARRCSGCHLTLSAMELERLRHAGDEMETCEQCSRILVVETAAQTPS